MSDGAETPKSASGASSAERATASRSGHQRSPSAVAPILDDETAAALTLYNTYLVADREQQAHERAIKKAEKAKDEAAAAVRKLNDRKAPAARTAEAEATYREAVEALRRLREGDAPAPQADDDAQDDSKGEVPGASHDDEQDGKQATDSEQDAPAEQAEGTGSGTDETAADDQRGPGDETRAAGDEADAATDSGESSSVGVEASVGDDRLAGDEPAGVAG